MSNARVIAMTDFGARTCRKFILHSNKDGRVFKRHFNKSVPRGTRRSMFLCINTSVVCVLFHMSGHRIRLLLVLRSLGNVTRLLGRLFHVEHLKGVPSVGRTLRPLMESLVRGGCVRQSREGALLDLLVV
jgi:hypothetical protein